MQEKIKSQREIITIVHTLKKKRKRVVVLTGCYDILHRGHIRTISQAKTQGDVLIVLINTDASVRAYKGNSRPVFSEKDRAFALTAIAHVDYVVLFGAPSPVSLIKKIRPHVYCNGLDWEKKELAGFFDENYIIPRTKGISTTNIIKKILA
jgi:rfaE bifunctional protein nucleotidyltransferase chain/domain